MRLIRDLLFRIRALLHRPRFETELDEELTFHLDMEEQKLRREGMSPKDARREARIRFGGPERYRQQAKESWGTEAVTSLIADLRYAGRQWRRNPAFTALAVTTLALGIGGTVALYSVVNGVMVRPLPFPEEERVRSFWMDYNWRGEEFDLIKELPRTFESIGAYSNDALTLQTEEETSMILATVASAELFDVLSVPALIGRGLQAGDDRAGAEPVVVLGHGLWSRAFGQDRGIVGRRINLSGVQTTVVGVMPEGFFFPSPEMQAFVPLNLDPADPAYANNGWLVLTGRLADDATEAEVVDDLSLITGVLGERYDYPSRWDKTRNPYVVSIREYLLGDVRPALLLLLAAAGLLLLMACVNVTALILSKTVDRAREMSVRAALGAGRGRLARQVLTESLALGCLAGLAGVALAAIVFDALVSGLPIDGAFAETLSLDWTALFVAMLLAIAAGSAIALAPIRNVLGEGGGGGGVLTERTVGQGASSAARLQQGLVVAEVVLAVVLVTGASLLVRTVTALRSLDPGLDPSGVLTVGVILPDEETAPEVSEQFFDELLTGTRALPGVSDAGLVNRVPLRDGGWQGPVAIEGRPDLEGVNRPNAMFRPVTPGALEALGVQYVRGRGILNTDGPDTPLVAVINETFARTVWGENDPIGRRFTTRFVGTVEVVGVTRDVAVSDLVGQRPMTAHYPWAQAMRGQSSGTVVVKTTGDPIALAAPMRTLARGISASAAIAQVQTMDQVMDAEMAEPLRLRFFLGLLSALGLILGGIGVYGVVAYSVRRRATEFGIRMALGARPGRLRREVVARALVPVALGVGLGAGVSLLASRALAGFLFAVAPTDPLSLLLAAAALGVAGLAAALPPALRAGSIHPARALRAE